MPVRAPVILALLLSFSCTARAAAPATRPAASTPQWWMHQALRELSYFRDPAAGNRRWRQSQLNLLGTLYDLQTAAGDRAGRVDTCRFALALLEHRNDTDDETLLLDTLPADPFLRYVALIDTRPVGLARDQARGRAVSALLERSDLTHALAIAIGIDDPAERDAALCRVVPGLVTAGRDADAVAAADHLAPPQRRSPAWRQLIPVYAAVAPLQAKLVRVDAARASLGYLAEQSPANGAERVTIHAARAITLAMLGESDACRRALDDLRGSALAALGETPRSLPTDCVCTAFALSPDGRALDDFIAAAPRSERALLHTGAAGSLIGLSRFAEAESQLAQVPAADRDASHARQLNRLTDAGQFDRVARVAALAPDESCGIHTYGTDDPPYEHLLASPALSTGLAAEVAAALASEPNAKPRRLATAARFAHRAGNAALTATLLDRAVAALTTDSVRRVSAEDIVRAQLATGHLDDAATLALADCPESIPSMVEAFAAAGRRADAGRLVRSVLDVCVRAASDGTDAPLSPIDLALAASYTQDPALLDATLPRAAAYALAANSRPWNFSTGPWRPVARAYANAGRLRDLLPYIAEVRRANSRALVDLMIAHDLLPPDLAPPLPE